MCVSIKLITFHFQRHRLGWLKYPFMFVNPRVYFMSFGCSHCANNWSVSVTQRVVPRACPIPCPCHHGWDILELNGARTIWIIVK